MQLVRGLHNLKPEHRECAVTIGNFDGVHHGHQALLSLLADKAGELEAPACLMSFDPLAHDAVGFDMLKRLLVEDGVNTSRHENMANPWLESAAARGLGTNDPQHIELVEVHLR